MESLAIRPLSRNSWHSFLRCIAGRRTATAKNGKNGKNGSNGRGRLLASPEKDEERRQPLATAALFVPVSRSAGQLFRLALSPLPESAD